MKNYPEENYPEEDHDEKNPPDCQNCRYWLVPEEIYNPRHFDYGDRSWNECGIDDLGTHRDYSCDRHSSYEPRHRDKDKDDIEPDVVLPTVYEDISPTGETRRYWVTPVGSKYDVYYFRSPSDEEIWKRTQKMHAALVEKKEREYQRQQEWQDEIDYRFSGEKWQAEQKERAEQKEQAESETRFESDGEREEKELREWAKRPEQLEREF